MDPLSTSDLDRICRCCMFSQEQEMVLLNAWLLEIYCAITSLQFNTEDTLPKLICKQCMTKMKIIKDFAEICIESNKRLTIIEHEAENTIKIEENNLNIKADNDIETSSKDSVNEIDKNACTGELLASDNSKMTKTVDKKKPIFVLNGSKQKFKLTMVKIKKSTKLKFVKMGKIYACDKCDMKFADPSFLKKHKLDHIKKEQKLTTRPTKPILAKITCYTCKTKFATKELRNKHYEDSTTCHPQQFVCEICNKSFKNKYLLDTHRNMHSDERKYTCNECGKAFKHVSNLKWHQRMHNGNQQMNHFCAFCGKGFALPCLLKLHEENHTKNGSYDCNKCDKNYASKLAFQGHIKYCNKDNFKRGFLCSECGKTSNTKEALKVHMRTHTGEKPYKCSQCPKSFVQHANLATHILVHSDTRPYACDLCDKSFKQSAHLKTHKLSHSGAKPHQCNICENKFVSAVNLRLHMLIHTGDKPIKCPHCGEGFADYKPRRVHVQQIHGISTSKKATNEHENNNT